MPTETISRVTDFQGFLVATLSEMPSYYELLFNSQLFGPSFSNLSTDNDFPISPSFDLTHPALYLTYIWQLVGSQ